MTDLERALADIAEVRDRLSHAQRFKGYSSIAAVVSGLFAIAAGVVQFALVPHPEGVRAGHLYFALWFACAAAAIAVNYGAIAHWYVNDASARDRWQTATVGFSMLPALLFGAALSTALLLANSFAYLPGVWFAVYGVGLFASRTMVPRAVTPVAAAFVLIGACLLFAPASIGLSWWVLPAGFGIGQILIGAFVARDARPRA